MWKAALQREFDSNYNATRGLFAKISDDELSWKPEGDNNWMTVGQLVRHITQACGWCCEGFVDGNWDMAALGYPEKEGEDGGLAPAEDLPTIANMAEANKRLDEDLAIAKAMLEKADDDRLNNEEIVAPWGSKGTLGQLLLDSTNHMLTHKTQLFYYLKMMGKPVNTFDLWGMPGA